MADVLTTYAGVQPDKIAVIDDRLGVDVRTVTYAEFEAGDQPARPRPGRPRRRSRASRSCGAGRTRWASPTSSSPPARSGRRRCPLNYRLSDDEAAYVTDHSDATVVYVDASTPRCSSGCGPRSRRSQEILVFDGPAPSGMTGVDELMAAAPTTPPEEPAATRRHRRHDDLHVGHDRQAEGRAAAQRRRPGAGRGDAAVHRLHARRRLHHDRAALPQRSRRVHGPRRW